MNWKYDGIVILNLTAILAVLGFMRKYKLSVRERRSTRPAAKTLRTQMRAELQKHMKELNTQMHTLRCEFNQSMSEIKKGIRVFPRRSAHLLRKPGRTKSPE